MWIVECIKYTESKPVKLVSSSVVIFRPSSECSLAKFFILIQQFNLESPN